MDNRGNRAPIPVAGTVTGAEERSRSGDAERSVLGIDLDLRAVAAIDMLVAPATVAGLVVDLRIVAADLLALGGAAGSGQCFVVGGKGFGPDVAQPVGPAAVMFRDMVGDLHDGVSGAGRRSPPVSAALQTRNRPRWFHPAWNNGGLMSLVPDTDACHRRKAARVFAGAETHQENAMSYPVEPIPEPAKPPVPPPLDPPPPISEPEPDRLPDEAPLPNPDENDNPAKRL